jgi:hypothetical protein
MKEWIIRGDFAYLKTLDIPYLEEMNGQTCQGD